MVKKVIFSSSVAFPQQGRGRWRCCWTTTRSGHGVGFFRHYEEDGIEGLVNFGYEGRATKSLKIGGNKLIPVTDNFRVVNPRIFGLSRERGIVAWRKQD